MTVAEVLGVTYVLLNNAGEDELDLAVAIEQYGLLASKMQFERIRGLATPEVAIATITFDDTSGIETNALENFDSGNVVYMTFDDEPVEQSSIDMLYKYGEADVQAVAFYVDATDVDNKVSKVQLSIQMNGTLKIWYEPFESVNRKITDTAEIEESKKYLIASRLAAACLPYVRFKDPRKAADRNALASTLYAQADSWRDIYEQLTNHIGNGSSKRLPFRAGRRVSW